MLNQTFHTRLSILSLRIKTEIQSFHIQTFHARLSFCCSIRRVEIVITHMKQLLILCKQVISLIEKNMLMWNEQLLHMSNCNSSSQSETEVEQSISYCSYWVLLKHFMIEHFMLNQAFYKLRHVIHKSWKAYNVININIFWIDKHVS